MQRTAIYGMHIFKEMFNNENTLNILYRPDAALASVLRNRINAMDAKTAQTAQTRRAAMAAD